MGPCIIEGRIDEDDLGRVGGAWIQLEAGLLGAWM